MQYSEVLSGTISITGTIIFTGTVGKATIYSLRFNNPAAYDITVSRYNDSDGSTLDLYNLSLAAGDIVSDGYQYSLNENDYIIITCSVLGTVYTAMVNYAT